MGGTYNSFSGALARFVTRQRGEGCVLVAMKEQRPRSAQKEHTATLCFDAMASRCEIRSENNLNNLKSAIYSIHG